MIICFWILEYSKTVRIIKPKAVTIK